MAQIADYKKMPPLMKPFVHF